MGKRSYATASRRACACASGLGARGSGLGARGSGLGARGSGLAAAGPARSAPASVQATGGRRHRTSDR
ncbi:hypothetical protein EGT41_20225 [Burkholderia cenocepacia]|uniref:Uncharacterized protein n=1 Tax=Burkholderia cenocepacia TaxID=95486 RepID=A0A427NTB5_9BURK|nr:hypothetical protein EGT41_20225 [Burkholderia cenocepacia]